MGGESKHKHMQICPVDQHSRYVVYIITNHVTCDNGSSRDHDVNLLDLQI